MQRCDELCCHKSHPFLYLLSDIEKTVIVDTANGIHNLYYNEDPKEIPKPTETSGRE
jgi:hypothetical protein